MTVEIDKAGRIVVPKKLRDAMQLTPGTQFQVERRGNTLVLEPEVVHARLIIQDGLPLIIPANSENAPVLTDEMVFAQIEQSRMERERRIFGLDEDQIMDDNA